MEEEERGSREGREKERRETVITQPEMVTSVVSGWCCVCFLFPPETTSRKFDVGSSRIRKKIKYSGVLRRARKEERRMLFPEDVSRD